MSHQHTHSHHPLNLADILPRLIELTQAGHLSWRRIDGYTWQAERQGYRVHYSYSDAAGPLLVVIDGDGRDLGEVSTDHRDQQVRIQLIELRAELMKACRLDDQARSHGLAELVIDEDERIAREHQARMEVLAERIREQEQRINAARSASYL